MDDWCTHTHSQSGLLDMCRFHGEEVEKTGVDLLEYIKAFVKSGKGILCGNSVHVDLQFIRREMPQVAGLMHYRVIDVSSVKELCRRWYPEIFSMLPVKKLKHTAVEDILESIEELRFYEENIFKKRTCAQELPVE